MLIEKLKQAYNWMYYYIETETRRDYCRSQFEKLFFVSYVKYTRHTDTNSSRSTSLTCRCRSGNSRGPWRAPLQNPRRSAPVLQTVRIWVDKWFFARVAKVLSKDDSFWYHELWIRYSGWRLLEGVCLDLPKRYVSAQSQILGCEMRMAGTFDSYHIKGESLSTLLLCRSEC